MRFTRRGLTVIAFLVVFLVGVCAGMWAGNRTAHETSVHCIVCGGAVAPEELIHSNCNLEPAAIPEVVGPPPGSASDTVALQYGSPGVGRR